MMTKAKDLRDHSQLKNLKQTYEDLAKSYLNLINQFRRRKKLKSRTDTLNMQTKDIARLLTVLREKQAVKSVTHQDKRIAHGTRREEIAKFKKGLLFPTKCRKLLSLKLNGPFAILSMAKLITRGKKILCP